MRLIGVIGGMSWESTAVYYRLLNELVVERLGGLHSARVLIHSVDFEPVARLQASGEWERMGRMLGEIARRLRAAGAEVLVIATNTMHVVAPEVEEAAGTPVLHIADVTAEAVRAAGVRTVGLLGTRFTMEHEFYRGRLAARHGLEVLVPDEGEREMAHRIIYEELCRGVVREESRQVYLSMVEGLIRSGARGIVLGCTELPLLLRPQDVRVPLFDTTSIHARAAVEAALDPTRREE